MNFEGKCKNEKIRGFFAIILNSFSPEIIKHFSEIKLKKIIKSILNQKFEFQIEA